MKQPDSSLLGKPTRYPDRYDASLLFPIARMKQREPLGLGEKLPFLGADLWTAFELSWLGARGKPQVSLAHITVPCESMNIIESKSLKLYLNSFNNTRFADAAEVSATLRADLSEAVWRGGPVQSSVGVKLVLPDVFDREPIYELDGLGLDRMELDCDRYTPAPEFLCSAAQEEPVSEVLTSNLLRSNCPVTGQPDWGSVQISYFGPQIDQAGLLRYIVSFRNHQGFHEDCVERMFMDIMQRCQPHKLSVYARYTRRGGLDINPFRTSFPQALPANVRHARQ
ncbi:MAG: NADPH-dependent 7-cyano-7-deazaguanine reductase QueF [Rhodoferax sp.]|nr:NADPH-dependent 7-cyano-7-deazaguanine reductase QueF [Rhodoferax sp.]OIP24534.1 MAG: NADPH-dependent 7-cyano-7-deazaguanine reductase QueF [Comamonadaceae bacterium CG2_30_60_41]PIW10678.1 MAG: NADPH-dependent 7-cyano-7-deazaguanine reductase QueF [Comamonadaceae bacterium CG17_big_fil_post_rev_8_21_14_2_50_60_13]PIY24210.1 MAG: NADPH-dependent 7-cyano-7-deazaguanine reductase QueF [Comamonadaceae bacterium CG_4_10_14_3_um_filter_60_75]PJC12025.1 MAG: NADPH-dependent 7-cyano-7-deazaguanine 